MAARRTSDTKSKETPSQSAAPPLYHRFLPHRVSSVRPTRAIRIETSFPTKGEGKVGAARRVLGILLCPEIIRIEDEIRVGRRNIFVVGLDLGWRKNSRLRSIFAIRCDRQLVGKGGANSKDWQGVAGIEIFRVERHVRLSVPTEDRLSLIYVTPVVRQARFYFHPTSCRRTRQDPVLSVSLSLSLSLYYLHGSFP